MECQLCPRKCRVNRAAAQGVCNSGPLPRVARAAPHFWEEPCLSGTHGSGTVFFTGCPLGCVFCQNQAISRGGLVAGRMVTPGQLAEIFLRLAQTKVHNLNLVTACHYRPAVQQALAIAKQQGLALPVVYNTGGYETVAAIQALQPDVDIWLTDLKFHSPELAAQLANAPDYFATATAALRQMVAQTGPPRLTAGGLMQSGVIVRLLVLPGHRQDAKHILHWLAAELPKGSFLLSLMSQYTPPPGVLLQKPFNRRVASFEYNDVLDTAVALGLTGGFAQARDSALEEYTPPFDLTGVEQEETL